MREGEFNQRALRRFLREYITNEDRVKQASYQLQELQLKVVTFLARFKIQSNKLFDDGD
jgi:hypothetical protein